MTASDRPDCDSIQTVPELIAYTRFVESESADRYQDFADQMEVHNNPEVAAVFRKLSNLSHELRERITDLSQGMDLPRVLPLDYRFECLQSLENAGMNDVHYLMTPHHVLTLGLSCKKQLAEFFVRLSDTSGDTQIIATAQNLKQAQDRHISLLEQWLADVPEPDEDWHVDPDPPTLQE